MIYNAGRERFMQQQCACLQGCRSFPDSSWLSSGPDGHVSCRRRTAAPAGTKRRQRERGFAGQHQQLGRWQPTAHACACAPHKRSTPAAIGAQPRLRGAGAQDTARSLQAQVVSSAGSTACVTYLHASACAPSKKHDRSRWAHAQVCAVATNVTRLTVQEQQHSGVQVSSRSSRDTWPDQAHWRSLPGEHLRSVQERA